MPAYMIFLREGEVVDQDAMERYQTANRKPYPGLDKLTPLVVYGKMETLEGDAADGMVVLQFPTIEDAKIWYYSKEYQTALKHRQQAAHYRVFMVEGL